MKIGFITTKSWSPRPHATPAPGQEGNFPTHVDRLQSALACGVLSATLPLVGALCPQSVPFVAAAGGFAGLVAAAKAATGPDSSFNPFAAAVGAGTGSFLAAGYAGIGQSWPASVAVFALVGALAGYLGPSASGSE